MTRFAAPIAEQIWDMKYRLKEGDGTPIDISIEDTWARIAKSLASVEKDPKAWEPKFYKALNDFRYLPAGRITAGAGTDRSVTLFNCFVMGTIPDTMGGIFDALREAALTMQQGGGIGYDFSTIRPKGAVVKGVAADASGPLSFMDVWDAMCRTIMSAGSRRGAMMATMRCDHPDVEDFITAKSDAARLRMFNMSVLITDPFMEAVKADSSHSASLRFVGFDYAIDLQPCRTGCYFHRPHQHDEQPQLHRNNRRDQPVWRTTPATLRRVFVRLNQPCAACV
jgi:ribonucleoside-diphosphate reductase alpha chain